MPTLTSELEPEIFDDPIDTLKKSPAYPYGLSERIVDRLKTAGINTVRNLYDAPDDQLDQIHYIGEVRVRQLKNAVAQAVWL